MWCFERPITPTSRVPIRESGKRRRVAAFLIPEIIVRKGESRQGSDLCGGYVVMELPVKLRAWSIVYLRQREIRNATGTPYACPVEAPGPGANRRPFTPRRLRSEPLLEEPRREIGLPSLRVVQVSLKPPQRLFRFHPAVHHE